jgi:hypothetical protein
VIQIDQGQLEKAREALAGATNGFQRAVASALGRTSSGLVTDAVKGTTKRYYAKSSEVRHSIFVKRAAADNLFSTISVRGRRKPIADYRLTPSSPSPGRKASLRGAVKKDGLKSLGDAFFVKGKPYFREGDGSLRLIISPSIPQIVKNPETVTEIEKGARDRFEKRLDHEILRLLGVFKK